VQRHSEPRGVGKGLAAGSVEAGIGDLPGMHRIDPDIPRRELQDRGFGQPAQPPFTGGVSGIVMRALIRRPRHPKPSASRGLLCSIDRIISSRPSVLQIFYLLCGYHLQFAAGELVDELNI